MKTDGLLLIDKPRGLSSAAVVEKVKRFFRAKKAGHGGTLDPMATGLLPVALGEGTKLLWLLLDGDKEYLAEATLGTRTDTDDAEGREILKAPVPALGAALVNEALQRQAGTIQQVPPAFSALKKDGKPNYERARAGESVEVEPRTVTIHALELLSYEAPMVRFRVACSKGTYVRSIARDLGEALGTCAHLSALRRTQTLGFSVEKASPLESLSSAELISCEALSAHLVTGRASEELVSSVTSGKAMRGEMLGFPETFCGTGRVLGPKGELLALVQLEPDGRITWLRGFVGLGEALG
jgi:tRNA pseudouridine55 synthase